MVLVVKIVSEISIFESIVTLPLGRVLFNFSEKIAALHEYIAQINNKKTLKSREVNKRNLPINEKKHREMFIPVRNPKNASIRSVAR